MEKDKDLNVLNNQKEPQGETGKPAGKGTSVKTHDKEQSTKELFANAEKARKKKEENPEKGTMLLNVIYDKKKLKKGTKPDLTEKQRKYLLKKKYIQG